MAFYALTNYEIDFSGGLGDATWTLQCAASSFLNGLKIVGFGVRGYIPIMKY